MPRCKPTDLRRSFTLIELLVVMTIIVVLATLAYFLLPTFLQRNNASRGADMLQGWLLLSKQLALRDQVPRGLYLVPDPNNPNWVRSVQLWEQPDNLSGGLLTVTSATTAQISQFPPGVLPTDFASEFSLGDYLEVPTGTTNPLHFITGISLVQNAAGQPAVQITVKQVASNPLPVSTTATPTTTINYRIVRAPRPMPGEEEMKLPQNIIIDLTPDGQHSYPISPPPSVILFAPSGNVLRSGGRTGKIILWVRDSTLDPNNPGEQTLIAVYTNTGLIAAHPADAGSANPYDFTQDGRASGL